MLHRGVILGPSRRQCFNRTAPERSHETSVVLVRHLPRAVVEFKLSEPRERAIVLLGNRERSECALVRLIEFLRRELCAQERKGDEDDHRRSQKRARQQPPAHAVTGTGASPYRSARRRCSRASGQRAMSEPRMNTKPPIQMRLTSGLT